MNLIDIIALSGPFIGVEVGINVREYDDTKKWLLTHNINRNFYEEKINNFKKISVRGKICYYLGAPGRLLAYRKYTDFTHKNPSL